MSKRRSEPGPPPGPEPLPLVPLRELVLFPGMITPLQITAPVMDGLGPDPGGRAVLFASHLRGEEEQPAVTDLAPVACAGRLLHVLSLPDGSARALVEGIARVRLAQVGGNAWDGFQAVPLGHTTRVSDPARLPLLEQALRTQLTRLLGDDLRLPPELEQVLGTHTGVERLVDWSVSVVNPTHTVQQSLLEETDLNARVAVMLEEAARAVSLLEVSNRVQATVQAAMDANQREYYLKEQLKAIRAELGEEAGPDDLDRLKQRLVASGLAGEAADEAMHELGRMRRMPSDAAEYNVARTWLDWLASLPWVHASAADRSLAEAKDTLDADHYGLGKVKDRILEYLAVRQLKPDARGPVLCFVGPPGVGKTSLGESIARAIGRTCHRVSLGGMKDESEIRGHRRTYIGAMPGRIVQAMKRAGTTNPVLILDELDKVGSDFRGDPASALLEVLDPTQNASFLDLYLGVPYDLSQVLFIATANVESTIPPALLDRLELIHLPGYTEEEKLEIAWRHLFPRVRGDSGLGDAQIRVNREALTTLIRSYTREAGVRELERSLARICRKAARQVVEGRKRTLRVGPDSLHAMLGPPPFHPELAEHAARPGVSIGLAWTSAGGEILFIEAALIPGGKGTLRLTGSLGQVMKESAEAALSLLRSRADGLGIPPASFNDNDFHVHVPAGAIPKDGPSAGLALLTAIASLLTGRKARAEVAMTGEITLRGKVLPVGGVKEKVLAARRAGVKQVILPLANRHDLEEDIPAPIRQELTFTWLDEVDGLFDLALEPRA